MRQHRHVWHISPRDLSAVLVAALSASEGLIVGFFLSTTCFPQLSWLIPTASDDPESS